MVISAMNFSTDREIISGEKDTPVLAINPLQIYHELTELIVSSNKKVEKRKQRLTKVSDLLGPGYEVVQNFDVHASPPVSPTTPTSKLLKWKTESSSFITSLTCDGTELYDLSLQVFLQLRTFLLANYVLKDHIIKGNILFILKGGNAQKRSLKRFYRGRSEEIDSAFGLDGDNDTCIMINPNFDEAKFDEIVNCILDLTCIFLNQMKGSEEFRKIDKIITRCVGKRNPDIRPVRRRNIDLNTYTFKGRKSELYVTRKDEYDFDPQRRFALIRLLKSYIAYYSETDRYRFTKSEVLDISILLRDNIFLQRDFKKYHDLDFAYIIDD